MLRPRALKIKGAAFALAAALLSAAPAAADVPSIGASCPGGAQGAQAGLGGNNVICVSSAWQYPAYQFGSTSASCNSTNAGIVQWTGSVLEYCNGSNWTLFSSANTVPLSGLLAATTTNSIDSANFAQTWKWGTLTTQTALSLTTSSLTSGTLLSLANTAAASTATGNVLSVTNASTGPGYGVYSVMSGLGNTGYAGYFTNTDTGAANYGLYASTSSASGYAGYFQGNVVAAGTHTANSYTPTSSTAPTNGMYLPAANSLGFSTSGSTALTISTTGYVGIETTAPAARLDVLDGTMTTGNQLRFLTDTDGNAKLQINNNYSGSPYQSYIKSIWNNGSDTRMDFAISASGIKATTTSPRIFSNGRIPAVRR